MKRLSSGSPTSRKDTHDPNPVSVFYKNVVLLISFFSYNSYVFPFLTFSFLQILFLSTSFLSVFFSFSLLNSLFVSTSLVICYSPSVSQVKLGFPSLS